MVRFLLSGIAILTAIGSQTLNAQQEPTGRVTVRNGGHVTLNGGDERRVTMKVAPGMSVNVSQDASLTLRGSEILRMEVPPASPPQEHTQVLPILITFFVVLSFLVWTFTRYRVVVIKKS